MISPRALKGTAAAFGFAAPIVAVVVWATTSLAAKADAARVDAVERRLLESDINRARMDERVSWLTSAVWAVAQRVGAPISPPPGGAP